MKYVGIDLHKKTIQRLRSGKRARQSTDGGHR
jgi:hypothetical protein